MRHHTLSCKGGQAEQSPPQQPVDCFLQLSSAKGVWCAAMSGVEDLFGSDDEGELEPKATAPPRPRPTGTADKKTKLQALIAAKRKEAVREPCPHSWPGGASPLGSCRRLCAATAAANRALPFSALLPGR